MRNSEENLFPTLDEPPRFPRLLRRLLGHFSHFLELSLYRRRFLPPGEQPPPPASRFDLIPIDFEVSDNSTQLREVGLAVFPVAGQFEVVPPARPGARQLAEGDYIELNDQSLGEYFERLKEKAREAASRNQGA